MWFFRPSFQPKLAENKSGINKLTYKIFILHSFFFIKSLYYLLYICIDLLKLKKLHRILFFSKGKHMQNKSFQIIFKEIGNLISLLALILLVPATVGILYSEWYSVPGFILAAGISLILGKGIRFIFRNVLEPQYKHGYFIAALGWLIMTMMGGVPLFDYIKNYSSIDNGIIYSGRFRF